MKNTKILLVLTVTYLFAIGASAQENNVSSSSFVPKEKGVYKKVSSKVIITKAKFGLREYPDEIYFSDVKGKLKNKMEILPNNIGNPNKVNISYSKKYLGIYRNYLVKKPDMEKGVLKEEFLVLDSTGGVLWETKGDALQNVFFNDDADGVSFLDPFSGNINEYTVYGKFRDKKSYSKWVEKYYPEEESSVKSKSVVSDDGRYIAVTRIAATKKEAFYELTLLGVDGNVIFQKNIERLTGKAAFISTGKKTVVVLESNYAPNLKPNGKMLKQYSGYDFSGKRIWSQSEDTISFDGHFSDDGNDYLFLNDKAKMDLGSGKIIR